MQICGIVAEFNPFHNGHQYIINKFKTPDNCILSVMSGNYVQRGEPALFSKFKRAEAALNCGVDLIVELPSPWSCSCAQNFSFGAISLLKNCGANKLVFGSESGNVDLLQNIAAIDRNLQLTDKQLKSGKTYAQLRQAAIGELLGADCKLILEGSNNNLGIEYLKAMQDLKCDFEVETISRCGSDHDSDSASDTICSASFLRDLIKNNNPYEIFIPEKIYNLYNKTIKDGKFTNHRFYESDVISYLRRFDSFDSLPDISEGIENKLYKAVNISTTYQELLSNIKSKRYTLARIRRLLLSAYLNLNKDWFLEEVPYINVLGFSKRGENALKQIAETTQLPVVISCKPNKPLSKEAQLLLNDECKRNDLYMSLLVSPSKCGSDHTNGLIKIGV